MPSPTFPRLSPTTTVTRKANRRPPLMTLATREIFTTPLVEFLAFFHNLAVTHWTATSLLFRHRLLLEIQSRFAAGIGQRLDAAVISIPTPVEHYLLNAGLSRSLGQYLAHQLGLARLFKSPSWARTSGSSVEADASVLPAASSITCATMCRKLRNTLRRAARACPWHAHARADVGDLVLSLRGFS